MVSLVLSLTLPLITLPAYMYHFLPGSGSIERPLDFSFLNTKAFSPTQNPDNAFPEKSHINILSASTYVLICIYITGALYRMAQLLKNLLCIRSSIQHNHRERRDKFWFIHLETGSPAYSFFNYIFVNKSQESLTDNEIESITCHESVHAKQLHTLDILFVELVSILFWFNPLMKFFRKYLTEVHEYLADEKILNNAEMKKSYSQLLLKLTTEEHTFNLSSAFSAKQISRRILMIEKARSLPWYRFLFLILLPAAVFLLMSFSYFENRSIADPLFSEAQSRSTKAAYQHKVGKITWINNTVYTDSQLNKALGIESGDDYSIDLLNERLHIDQDAASSLYMDHGYLFFSADVKESPKDDGTMDLTITIYEGLQVKIRQILITGNGNIPKKDIMEKILIQEGELFSKTKLINSVHAIAQMDQFDPENILPNPTPIKDPLTGEFTQVDIEFKLTEK